MILRMDYYTLKCDNCGEVFADEYSVFQHGMMKAELWNMPAMKIGSKMIAIIIAQNVMGTMTMII